MSKKKTMLIVVSAILMLFVVVCCLFVYFVFSTREKVSYNIDKWNSLEKTFTYLPSVEEMGEYTDLKCKYLHKDSFIFQTDAYTLRATYSEKSFDKQKDYINSNYIFQETVVNYGEETIVKDARFSFDGFQFQMLSLKEYNLSYPKYIVFVGVSDENNEIAFVFFEDVDLDYIENSFSEFLVEECGWE